MIYQAGSPPVDPRWIESMLYWGSAGLRLPRGGIDTVFMTEDACRDRLTVIRWPDGVICPFCEAEAVSELATRRLFRCRKCRRQFSATSGTLLHNTHVPILLWFVVAETLIRHYVRSYCGYHKTNRQIASKVGLSYRGAVRVKEIVLRDIAPTGPGMLRESICVENFSHPQEKDLESVEYVLSLRDLFMKKQAGFW